MISRSLGILAALASVSAFAQSSKNHPSGSTEKAVQHYFGPIRDLTDHGDGTSSSSNWSGYAVLGSSFTSAGASWVVPQASCSGVGRYQYAAFWVGIDGYNSNTVEQIGTDSDCDLSHPSYYAWYEFYPRASHTIASLAVRPGNEISASVVYLGSDEFKATITNQTTGQSFTVTRTISGAARSSAEWIIEAPCCTASGGILPLADFGTIALGADSTGISGTNYATDNSTSGPIGSFPAVNTIRIDKTGTNSSPETSTCSALSSDGTSFACTWAP